MAPQAPLNIVFVQMEAYDEVVKTQSGVLLYKDVTYQPEWSATVTANVVSVPRSVRYSGIEYNRLREFVQPGDTLIFEYLVVEQKTQHETHTEHHNRVLIDGKTYWKVDYSMILGVFRNGKLLAAPGKVFAKEIQNVSEEKIGSLYVPDNAREKTLLNEAVVVVAGLPLEGDPNLGLATGDRIYMNGKVAFPYEIEGERYLVVDQKYIMGKA